MRIQSGVYLGLAEGQASRCDTEQAARCLRAERLDGRRAGRGRKRYGSGYRGAAPKGPSTGRAGVISIGMCPPCAYKSFSIPGSRLAERLVQRLRSRSNPCPFRLVLLRFSLEMGVRATAQPVLPPALPLVCAPNSFLPLLLFPLLPFRCTGCTSVPFGTHLARGSVWVEAPLSTSK